MVGVDRRKHRIKQEIVSALGQFEAGDPTPAISKFLPDISNFVEGGKAVTFAISRTEDGGASVDECTGTGLDVSSVLSNMRRLFQTRRHGLATWDAVAPNRRDRNRAVVASLIEPPETLLAYPMYTEVLCKSGLRDHDTMRILLCDGPSVALGIAFLRETMFSASERALLAQLAGTLQRRLAFEVTVGRAGLAQSRLQATLEAVGAPAFLLNQTGGLLLANSAGIASLDADRLSGFPPSGASLRDRLRHAVTRSDESEFRLLPISHGAGRPEILAIARPPTLDVNARATLVGRRWGLTPKQVKVLALVAMGLANKTIAAHLDRAEVTIELHVTAILARAQCDSRAALVARFWTEPVSQ